jgi:NAD(P)-dependent dehydrogenase (short-subunit alcohol dehydrogenase family)
MGSWQGIGRGIVCGLAQEGAKVIPNNRKPDG